MYSRELASARQVEPVNQALGTVIFSGVYHKGACPTLQGEKINQALNTDVNSLTEIDSDSRMSPTVCKLTHRNRKSKRGRLLECIQGNLQVLDKLNP
ncbi:hypothetical protein EVAR_99649_1 [Eumeta japonica]|uniref:Uncharacterized protein n=1 Tax=Eumeta variegata TaxID=151549 RepID=A0A4C1ZKJ0_EUMVA|nr:hypothetical protein EVAR_99649_1 [Eumeta japonica]